MAQTLPRNESGVTQGSIIGPTLYTIYTNDIPVNKSTHLAINADDIAIYSSSWNHRQVSKYIQQHLNQILDYYQKWKLRVNPQKTQAITFTRKTVQYDTHITIHDYQIP